MWLSLVLEMVSGFLGHLRQDRVAPKPPLPETRILPLRVDPQEDLQATWWE